MNISNLENFPTEKSFAIATSEGVHIPGDERSRSAPGHGYPSHTDYYTKLQVFSDEAEWKEAIKKLMVPQFGSRKDFRAFIMEPVTVDAEITVNIK